MMDGDVARISSGNDDFDIIGDSPGCSKSDGDGVVVSVEVDLMANGDELSPSKQLDDEESNRMNGDVADQDMKEEDEIANGRIEQEEDGEDKPKQSAEELMNEFDISLDSHDQEEEETKAVQDAGEAIEEDEVSATTFKTEEASISLDALHKQEEAEPAPEAEEGGQDAGVSIEVDLIGKGDDDMPDTQDSTPETPEDSPETPEDSPETPEDSPETPEDSPETPEDSPESLPEEDAEDTPKDSTTETPEDSPEDIPESMPEDAPTNIPEDDTKDLIEDYPKDIPDADEDPNKDSAVDVNLDTTLDTSNDISQDISLDASLDQAQDNAEEEKESTSETPVSHDDDQTPTEQSLDASLNSDEENERFHPGLTRSKSNRLDSSKFSKFESSSSTHSSDSEGSSGSKRHSAGTGRLNMSRFSQFEQGSDSSDGGSRPIKRNFGTRSKSLKFGSATVTSELCHVCQKRVYPMEKITADNIIYHKTCFKCSVCKKTLSLGTYAALQGVLFCKPHFKQNFKLKGKYDFGIQKPPQETNGVSGIRPSNTTINSRKY